MNPWLEQMWDMASAQFWQVTTLGIIGLLLAKTVFRRRPQIAYMLLMLVIVKALIPPVVPGYSRMFDWSWAKAASSQDVPAEQPFAGVDPNERVVAEADAPEMDAGVLADFEEAHPTKSSFMQRLPLWALLIWSAGIVATGFYVVTTWIRRMRTLCQDSRDAHPALIDLLNEVSSTVARNRKVRLLISEHEGPCSFGIVAPTIVLPGRLINKISQQNLKLILAHELIHIRRGDGLAACFQVAAIVLWWFHPVVWLISRQLSQVREKCCDVDVLESTECKSASYAQGVLDVLKVTTIQSQLSLESGFGSAEFTEERLMMIMNRTENTFLARRWFFWSLFAIGLAAVVPGKFSAAQSNDRPEANATTSSDDQWARLSPFTRVQVDGDEVDVVYNGKWYSLKSIAGSSTEQILESARDQFGDIWEKRFVEDLVEVLTGMGHEVGKSVELELIDPKTNEVTMVSDAPLTSENRRFVYSAYQEQERAQQISKNADATKIHELIKRFAKAAGAGDTDEVFNTLHPARGTDRVESYINSSREMQEMNIKVSKLKLVEVMPEQGQAFAATDFFPFHPAGGESRCVVFNCKLDEGKWKIRDIDLEDLEGYSHEFLRFVDRARKTE